MVWVSNDLVEKLLVRFLAQLSRSWQVWRASLAAEEEEGVNSLSVCHVDEAAPSARRVQLAAWLRS